MIVASLRRLSDRLSPSTTAPRRAERRPRLSPRSRVCTSWPALAKPPRTRPSSALNAAAMPVAGPIASSSAVICASRSSARSSSSIAHLSLLIGKGAQQRLQPVPRHRPHALPLAQHQAQLHRRQRPELRRSQAKALDPRPHQRRPVEPVPHPPASGRAKARASNFAAARAARPRSAPARRGWKTRPPRTAPPDRRASLAPAPPPTRPAPPASAASHAARRRSPAPPRLPRGSPCSENRKAQPPRRGEAQLIGRLAVMGSAILDRRHLKRPLDGAEIRDHHLKIRHLTVKEDLPRARR